MKTKEQVKLLWKLCFNETESFVDFYFNKRYRNDINIAIQVNAKIVSALQTIPYPMTFFSEIIDTAYLSGICTHPDFRNRGLMAQLLDKTHKTLYKKDIYVSNLIPAELQLFDMYAKYGYKTIFFREKHELNTSDFQLENNLTFEDVSSNNISEAYPYFNLKLIKHNFCVLHDFADFEIICEDIQNAKGKTIVAKRDNKIVGIAFAAPRAGSYLVLECIADSGIIKQSLLKTIATFGDSQNLTCIEMQANAKQSLGMLRIINAEKVLQLYAEANPVCSKTIDLLDTIIPENSGSYYINEGICLKSALNTDKKAWDIAELTEFVFKDSSPYMSLMLSE